MILGVSSCLLGNMCRYDGHGAKDDFVFTHLKNYFELLPYCPENSIWKAPRDAIRQVLIDDKIKIVTSTKEQKDVTNILEEACKNMVLKAQKDDLCGFILKSSSPSCGMDRVKVYKPFNAPSVKNGVGVFAKKLKEKMPYLPIEEEGRLNDAWLRENFLMQVYSYGDLKDFFKLEKKISNLVDFHTSYKYLIYSKSQNSYKILGNLVANQQNQNIEELYFEYEKEFLKAIAIKSTLNKTFNILLHIFGYFKKHITKEEKADILESLFDFKNRVIPLISVIKIFNIYINKFDIAYLKNQKFLNPYPSKLALRSDLGAFK
ncbi:YbgA family protein [Aliarcobacter vitoriensis]|uniref:YbgA family protein n=1 Tax=Aliarcobacter vitoriensis TaxID=2011099 RepID=UPI003AAFFAC7